MLIIERIIISIIAYFCITATNIVIAFLLFALWFCKKNKEEGE